MPKITLTPKQKSALESRHKKVRDARECDRIKAVLLNSEGWSVRSIAQALRLSEYSISRHLGDYLKQEKLKPENGGINRGFHIRNPKGFLIKQMLTNKKNLLNTMNL